MSCMPEFPDVHEFYIHRENPSECLELFTAARTTVLNSMLTIHHGRMSAEVPVVIRGNPRASF